MECQDVLVQKLGKQGERERKVTPADGLGEKLSKRPI